MNRNQFSIDGSGRRFTGVGLSRYRDHLCHQLESSNEPNKIRRAESYRKMTLTEFANHGGYVITKSKS